MRALLLLGDHPRHRFLAEPVIKNFNHIKCILMKRESYIKGPNYSYVNNREKKLIEKHFKLRFVKEKKAFGIDDIYSILKSKEIKEVSKNQSNSKVVVNEIKKFKPTVCFIIGYGIISKIIQKKLPINTINIHLGLSPWYRGSATLFWPTYNMEPWKTGVTFHKINNYADSGDILHQCVPKFDPKMGVIDTSIKAIEKAKKDFDLIIKAIKKGRKLYFYKQPFVGRSYLTQSFRGTHLIQIYEKFGDKILNYFFRNKFKFPKIKLIQMKFK